MTGSPDCGTSDSIMTPDRLFTEYKFSEKALEEKVVDFGKDPETGVSFVKGVEVLRKLEKVNTPGKPYLKTYNAIEKMIKKFREEWPTVTSKESEEPKRKPKPKTPTKNRKQCEEFESRNEKEYLEEKAKEDRKDLEKKKQRNLETMLQERMRVYLCETCERIAKSGRKGGRPKECSRGCYSGIRAESKRTGLYNKWKKEFTAKLDAAEKEATNEVNESSEDEVQSDKTDVRMSENEVFEKTSNQIAGVIDVAKILQDSVEVLTKHYETASENAQVSEVEVDSRLTSTNDLDNYRPLETLERLRTKSSTEAIIKEISDDDDSAL